MSDDNLCGNLLTVTTAEEKAKMYPREKVVALEVTLYTAGRTGHVDAAIRGCGHTSELAKVLWNQQGGAATM